LLNTTIESSSIDRDRNSLSGARIIGDDLWAPVREQLILNLHPKHKRAEQMANQHFRCADCGIQIRYDKIKTFLYCEYFGKYFCRCCHVSQQSYIPAYVVYLSDYRTTFEVSKKAKNFLEKIYNEPLITLESLNPNLFRDESSLFVKMKRLRSKLYNCRSYLNSCRFGADLKENLEANFDDFIINDQHVYSIETLFKLKKSNYYDQLKLLVQKIIEHIKTCELCKAQGFICGLCNKTDLLYPFDFETVEKCPNCLACYHKACFKTPENCPRCLRKKMRAKKQSP
jgi:run domain Beclin-1 interacting cysteine-rich containing protein